MIATVNNPRNRIPLPAALIHRLDRVLSVGLRLRVDGRAPVVLHKPIPQLPAAGNVEDRIRSAVLTVESNRGVSSVAAAQLATGDDGDSTDHGRSGTGDSIGHGAAVAEPSGEPLGGLHAEIGFDSLDELIEEGDVLAALVGPAGVETVGDDKDGGVVGESVEAVVREGAALVDVLAVDDLLGAAAELVPGEDELVGKVVVVAVGDLHDVLALLAVDGDGVLLAPDGVGLAAACGPFGHHGTEQAQHQERQDCQEVGSTRHLGLW